MKVAFQMEAMDKVSKEKSATILMMAEAQKRGYEIFHYTSETISVSNEIITADLIPVTLHMDQDTFYTLGERIPHDLKTIDIIVMRQDPPVDMAYLTLVYILNTLKNSGVFITNDPAALFGFPEKMSIFEFPEHIPPTIVTSRYDQAEAFFHQHQNIIVKPLYLFSGHGIKQVQNLDELKPIMADLHEPVMIQKFLPEIAEGNKRIIMFDGEIVAALNTPPAEGDFIAYNAGIDHEYTPSEDECSLCKKIGAYAKQRGAHFIGVDFIGKYLTEINVTSVGSLYRVNKAHNVLAEKFWDMIEKKYAEFKKYDS